MAGIGRGNAALRAKLLRVALAEIQVFANIPMGEAWREIIAAADLSPEDGWALVEAARLLAAHPDPDLWCDLATR